jgi:hypothetical protein
MRFLVLLLMALLVSSCASAPKTGKGISPEILYNSACGESRQVQSVQGNVWLKTQSPELTGQFSASVSAKSPDQLTIEFMNILGGTEAIVTVKGNRYEVNSSDRSPEKRDTGYGSWGGIPLRWATNLFLGKIPCPVSKKGTSGNLQSFVNDEGELVLTLPKDGSFEAQQFIYSFVVVRDRPWPASLHWQPSDDSKKSVDFKFSSPDEATLSPKLWEIRSAKGAIKVKWQEREVSFEDSPVKNSKTP